MIYAITSDDRKDASGEFDLFQGRLCEACGGWGILITKDPNIPPEVCKPCKGTGRRERDK